MMAHGDLSVGHDPSPSSFVVSTGRDKCQESPRGNIDAFMESSRDGAVYSAARQLQSHRKQTSKDGELAIWPVSTPSMSTITSRALAFWPVSFPSISRITSRSLASGSLSSRITCC